MAVLKLEQAEMSADGIESLSLGDSGCSGDGTGRDRTGFRPAFEKWLTNHIVSMHREVPVKQTSTYADSMVVDEMRRSRK